MAAVTRKLLWRVLWLKAAIPTIIGDAIKGAVAVLLVRWLFYLVFPDPDTMSVDEATTRALVLNLSVALAGGFAVIGLALVMLVRHAMRMMRTIYYNLGKIFQIAKRDGIPTYKAADRMAEERINQIGNSLADLTSRTEALRRYL